MEQLRSPGVVLQAREHGDADVIVTLYTLEQGKIAAIAKGAKRSKRRFVNKLEPFTLLDLLYTPGRTTSLMRLDQADLLAPHPSLREDYVQFLAASLVCELVLHWTRDHDCDPSLFRLLVWVLTALASGRPIGHTVICFHLRLLDLLGYRPNLASCQQCDQPSGANPPYHFSLSRGGLLCGQCIPRASGQAFPISMQTAQLLRKVLELETGKLDRLLFPPPAIAEALRLLQRYDSQLLQKELHSWRFLLAAIPGC
ncbi:MAG: DNA repair protein RecO [Thermodesulfobacteriota bacterium]